MNHNFKTLGLALLTAFALSAVAAAAASAQQGLLTSDGPVTLRTEETGGAGSNVWTMFGQRTECPGSTPVGHKFNVTPHSFIPSGSTTITLTPNYKNCISPFGFLVTMDMNGCDYVAHIGQTTASVDTYGVVFDIVCAAGQEITKTIFTNAAAHAAGTPFCIIHIPPQIGLAGAHVTDTTNGHIDITGTVQGIKATRTASATHPLLCPHSTTETASMDIDVTVRGLNEVGAPTSIGISEGF
jgi:hypothetical protein